MGDDFPPGDDWSWPAPDEPGRVLFDRYRLVERIGEGATGVVWRVWHIDLECERALKLVRPEIARNERAWRRLEHQARLLMKRKHPGIVAIYDIKRVRSIGFIEMELVRGRTLADVINERQGQPMPLDWIVQVLDQLCSVLDAAHGYVDEETGKPAPIIHGNLKPANLILVQGPNEGAPPRLKVLGFDVAEMIYEEASPTVTASGELSGTPAYMSPEQIQGGFEKDGQRDDLAGRSDLYSTGVLLYQLLTGYRPFRGNSMAVLAAHLNSPPPPMNQVNPAVRVHPRIERAVMRCLEKDPSRRPQSASALAEMFRPVAVPVTATAPIDRPTSMPPPKSSKPEVTEVRATEPTLGGPTPSVESLVGRLLKWFQRPQAPEPAAGPTVEDVKSTSKPGGQQQAPVSRVRRPGAGLESTSALESLRSPIVGMKLYVGNLADMVNETDLEQLFSEFGTVQKAQVFYGRETGRSKGFGFVEMSDEAEARAAMAALHDREHQGRRLTVNEAKPREYRGAPDKPATIKPTTIRRHTDVSFPAVVQAGKVYNLRVQVVPAEEALPSGEVRERPRPHAHDATLNLLVAPPTEPDTSPPPVKLTISIAAENFEIDGPSRAEIVVPLDGKSPAVQFHLQGLEAGPGRIMVDFAQEGRPAGSVDLTPEVVAELTSHRPPSHLGSSSEELSLSLGIGPAPAPPDVVLKVFEHRMAGHPGRLQFVLSSTHPALADLPVLDGDLGTLDLRTEVAAWVGEQLRAVGDLAGRAEVEGSADDAAQTMAAVGFNLFQQLLPPAVQELSWTFRRRGVKTLLVLSDEPHIPWELIKPFRADPISGAILCEDGFWGESYAMAHWLRGRPPVARLSIARVLGVAAGTSGPIPSAVPEPGSSTDEFHPGSTRDMVRIDTSATLSVAPIQPEGSGAGDYELDKHGEIAAGDEELALLRSLEALGARVERLPALRRAVRQAFEEGSFDLLHLISHGSSGGPAAGDASAVFLDDGAFTAAELSPRMAAALRRAAPLVIFNTCHCGRIGFSLTRLGSWGAHLVHLGCGGFVGALWPVSDRAALAFARAFYEQLARKCPLGEAVRLARLHVRERYPDDPTWLAYCCFADPMAQVEATATVSRPRRGRY